MEGSFTLIISTVVREVNSFSQTGPLIPEPRFVEVEVCVESLRAINRQYLIEGGG